jgi:hypothetical protein
MKHLYIRRLVNILGIAFVLACAAFAVLRVM